MFVVFDLSKIQVTVDTRCLSSLCFNRDIELPSVSVSWNLEPNAHCRILQIQVNARDLSVKCKSTWSNEYLDLSVDEEDILSMFAPLEFDIDEESQVSFWVFFMDRYGNGKY